MDCVRALFVEADTVGQGELHLEFREFLGGVRIECNGTEPNPRDDEINASPNACP